MFTTIFYYYHVVIITWFHYFRCPRSPQKFSWRRPEGGFIWLIDDGHGLGINWMHYIYIYIYIYIFFFHIVISRSNMYNFVFIKKTLRYLNVWFLKRLIWGEQCILGKCFSVCFCCALWYFFLFSVSLWGSVHNSVYMSNF